MRKSGRGKWLAPVLAVVTGLFMQSVPVYAYDCEFVQGADGKMYWYENDVIQGTVDDPQGVQGTDPETGEATNRGREIYDSATDAWYWLDSCYGGAKACGKEVWIPYVYQGEKNFSDEEIMDNVKESDSGIQQYVENAIRQGTGKWVRYDENGKMLKGWVTITGALAQCYPEQAGNKYYYDHKTGIMAKGNVYVNGTLYHFDENTGVCDSSTSQSTSQSDSTSSDSNFDAEKLADYVNKGEDLTKTYYPEGYAKLHPEENSNTGDNGNAGDDSNTGNNDNSGNSENTDNTVDYSKYLDYLNNGTGSSGSWQDMIPGNLIP